MYSDFHVHTTMSDGENTPAEMVETALRLGMPAIGISDHSYVSFDDDYCLDRDYSAYRHAINELKDRYRGKIRVLCGIEQDYHSDNPATGFDYVIGSVHYIRAGEELIAVDLGVQPMVDAAARYFGGDMYALIEEYFRAEADVVRKTGADIIGHFDLIRLYLEPVGLLLPCHPRYVAAWQKAADELLKTGVPFEINTAPLYGGKLPSPYPSPEIIDYLRLRGGRFILSSDSHKSSDLCKGFDKMEEINLPLLPSP